MRANPQLFVLTVTITYTSSVSDMATADFTPEDKNKRM